MALSHVAPAVGPLGVALLAPGALEIVILPTLGGGPGWGQRHWLGSQEVQQVARCVLSCRIAVHKLFPTLFEGASVCERLASTSYGLRELSDKLHLKVWWHKPYTSDYTPQSSSAGESRASSVALHTGSVRVADESGVKL